MTTQKMTQKSYIEPRIEVIEMMIEAGFQASQVPTTSPESDNNGVGAESMNIIEW
jgi:hypothetical protein